MSIDNDGREAAHWPDNQSQGSGGHPWTTATLQIGSRPLGEEGGSHWLHQPSMRQEREAQYSRRAHAARTVATTQVGEEEAHSGVGCPGCPLARERASNCHWHTHLLEESALQQSGKVHQQCTTVGIGEPILIHSTGKLPYSPPCRPPSVPSSEVGNPQEGSR